MRRVIGIAATFSFLALVGCGGGAGKDGGGAGDMAGGGNGDLSGVVMPDLVMTLSGAPTGDPCTKNSDCAGTGAKCVKQTNSGMTLWQDGYCTSTCSGTNDPSSGVNMKCPGGNGTCDQGGCYALCMLSSDCRMGYKCFGIGSTGFYSCAPASGSQCNPSVMGSCSSTPDGGAADGGGLMTCVNIGAGDVGQCVPSCDPFAADGHGGCPGTANQTDCHASDVTGEGLCTGAAAQGIGAGSTCGHYYSDCPGGYGCYMGKCWHYCNDANKATRCSSGATCEKQDAAQMVPTSVAGLCTASS